MKDYYAILGVAKDASYGDIKKAWRDKARQWHPDTVQTEDEKLAAHTRFVEIVEAYSVLIDAKQRAAYDSRVAAGAAGIYTGYENATPEQDQQEAADWFQRILSETPSEFAKSTLVALVMFPVTLIICLGIIGMLIALYHVMTGQSALGVAGGVMLIFLFFGNLLVAFFGAFMIKDLYYRIKRIFLWIAMRARTKRVFSRLFKRKPGRRVAVRPAR